MLADMETKCRTMEQTTAKVCKEKLDKAESDTKNITSVVADQLKEAEEKSAAMIAEAEKKSADMMAKAKKDSGEMREKAKKDSREMVEKAKKDSKKYWDDVSERLNAFCKSQNGLSEMLTLMMKMSGGEEKEAK